MPRDMKDPEDSKQDWEDFKKGAKIWFGAAVLGAIVFTAMVTSSSDTEDQPEQDGQPDKGHFLPPPPK